MLFTLKEDILDFKFISLTKLSFCLFVILKANTSLFPAAKALKHNKRQEKTKGIEPFTKESPNPQNKTENPATVPCCCLQVRVPRFHCNKAVLTAQAVCTAAVSPTNAFFIYFLLFLFLHLNKKEITTHLFFHFFSTIL